MQKINVLVLSFLFVGCVADTGGEVFYAADAPVEAAPAPIEACELSPAGECYVNACDPWEDVQRDDTGAIVHGISQCAICRRFEDAYYQRAAELGCAEPYPLDGCPIDVGGTDCIVDTVEEWADGSWATDCAMLVRWFGQLESLGGYLCGDACTITNPYAVSVTSTVVQEPRPISNPSWGLDWCCPDTPYALRERCPFWCDGPNECGWAECRALYESRR